MSQKAIRTRLSAYRRRWGITQDELAYILGLRGNACVSRLEDGVAKPTLYVIFGLYVLFGDDAHEIFPAHFAKVEEEVLTRAYDLYERTQGSRSKLMKAKLDFLESVFARRRNGKSSAV